MAATLKVSPPWLTDAATLDPMVRPVQMEVEPAQAGLCSTCNRASECRFPRPADRPIVFCDEFDGATRPTAPQPLPLRQVVASVHSVNPAAGLCRVCSKFATCVFPKPAGGVWQCEEFD